MSKTKETYTPNIYVNPSYNPIQKIDRDYNKPVNLFVLSIPTTKLPENALNVYLDNNEPSYASELIGLMTIESEIKERTDLDLILTKRVELIENSKCKSVLFPFGTSWAKNTQEKEFGVSFLITAPIGQDGYNMRHQVWHRKDEIKIPKKFYNSSMRPKQEMGGVVGGHKYIKNIDAETIGNGESDKKKIFDTMYSIIIENTREPYWFTEKLIDCLQSKTIPVYYGCSRLEEFFNMDGVIVVDTAEEIIDVCNTLSESDYKKRKDAIEENYEKSIQYSIPFYKRVFDIIEKELELKSVKHE